jgi:hypothetical protein
MDIKKKNVGRDLANKASEARAKEAKTVKPQSAGKVLLKKMGVKNESKKTSKS